MSRIRTFSADTTGGIESVYEPAESLVEDDYDGIVRPNIIAPIRNEAEDNKRRSARAQRSRNSTTKRMMNKPSSSSSSSSSHPKLMNHRVKSYPLPSGPGEMYSTHDLPRSQSARTSHDDDDNDNDDRPLHPGVTQFRYPAPHYNNSPRSSNSHAWHESDIPVLAVCATPVNDDTIEMSEDVNKLAKESRKAARIQKCLIFLVLALLAVAGVTAVHAWRTDNQNSDNSNNNTNNGNGSSATNDSLLPNGDDTDNDTDNVIDSSDLSSSTTPSIYPSHQPTMIPSFSPSIARSSPPSPIPTFQPSTKPSTKPSIKPSITQSAIPSSSPSSHPSLSPSTTVPTAQPTLGCQKWCANHVAPWFDLDNPTASQKCKWPKTCAGCPECSKDYVTNSPTPSSSPTITPLPPCEKWCATNQVNPWYDPDPTRPQKCRFKLTCAGCPECSDPTINPPAGNFNMFNP